MTLLVLLAALAVLCVAALAVSGVSGFPANLLRDELPDAEPDRAPFGELTDEVGPEHVRSLRFSLAFRGYRMDQVDAALDRLADELATRDARIAELAAGTSREEHDRG